MNDNTYPCMRIVNEQCKCTSTRIVLKCPSFVAASVIVAKHLSHRGELHVGQTSSEEICKVLEHCFLRL